MTKQASNPVKSAINTLEIVEGLYELDGAGVTELAAHLDLPKSNVHNYLSTLRQKEYVVKEGDTYRVGLRFFELGAYARDKLKVYKIARPEVEKLAEETGELANLLVEEHGRGSYIYRASGDQAVQVDAYAGARVHLHNTALGKAILAHLPEEFVDEIVDYHGLPAGTPRTITNREVLKSQLEEIRASGFALDDEERLKGLRCVAAPILSEEGRALGALSVSGPTTRLKGSRFEEELPEMVLEAVNVAELNVTYS